MRRTLVFPLLGVAVVFAFAMPAVAQSSSSSSSSSSYGTPPPSGGPEASVGTAEPTDTNPGDTVTFDTGDALGDCTSADVFFVRGLQDASGDQIRNDAPVTNGSLSVQFQVPTVPAGIYFVYATCTDSSGQVLQSLGVVVVFTAESPPGAGPAAMAASPPAPSASIGTVPTPDAIAALQTTPATEQTLLADASASGGSLTFIGGQLAVSHRPSDSPGAGAAIPVASVGLAAVAVLGLVLLRRRHHRAA